LVQLAVSWHVCQRRRRRFAEVGKCLTCTAAPAGERKERLRGQKARQDGSWIQGSAYWADDHCGIGHWGTGFGLSFLYRATEDGVPRVRADFSEVFATDARVALPLLVQACG
jgi:hypothetical protein